MLGSLSGHSSDPELVGQWGERPVTRLGWGRQRGQGQARGIPEFLEPEVVSDPACLVGDVQEVLKDGLSGRQLLG